MLILWKGVGWKVMKRFWQVACNLVFILHIVLSSALTAWWLSVSFSVLISFLTVFLFWYLPWQLCWQFCWQLSLPFFDSLVCLVWLTVWIYAALCILFKWFVCLQNNFSFLFVNQEESLLVIWKEDEKNVMKIKTIWFRPTTFNDEFLINCLKMLFQFICIDFSFSGSTGKYQLGQGKQQ